MDNWHSAIHQALVKCSALIAQIYCSVSHFAELSYAKFKNKSQNVSPPKKLIKILNNFIRFKGNFGIENLLVLAKDK
jgi:hypothetical protein